jgi:hypothetical protein
MTQVVLGENQIFISYYVRLIDINKKIRNPFRDVAMLRLYIICNLPDMISRKAAKPQRKKYRKLECGLNT